MTSGLVDTQLLHPLLRLVAELERLASDVASAPAWTLTPTELTDALPRLAQVQRRLAAIELRMLREADRHQIGDPVGAANTAAWWATTTRITKPAAHRAVALAEQLDDDRPTASAVTDGVVSIDQAAVILDAVDALPVDTVDSRLRRDAEQHLIGLAAHHDTKDLRILGRRILEVIAPDLAEEHERRLLERDERGAAAAAHFSIREDGHGSVRGRFKIPVLHGEMLKKHLFALAAPKHRHATGEPETSDLTTPVSRPLRLGRAFMEYIETRSAEETPKAGGIAATIVVTLSHEALVGACEKAGVLDTGVAISAAEARRLACEAGIIPAVLGGRGQPLDIGRKARFHNGPQRIALMLRDRGCRALGCDWPPGMCHAHHGDPWSKGGATNVERGMLFCPHHHALAHDGRYQLKTDPSGRVTFTRRR